MTFLFVALGTIHLRRRQIWQIFDPSPPKACRRLKWMVPYQKKIAFQLCFPWYGIFPTRNALKLTFVFEKRQVLVLRYVQKTCTYH